VPIEILPHDQVSALRLAGERVGAKDVLQETRTRYVYSICTMVTDYSEYLEMCLTFSRSGFDKADCEYLYIDNSNRQTMDGFSGMNFFLNNAAGDYIILCHQDVRLDFDRREKLDEVIQSLAKRDPNWALCGNSGGIRPGRMAIRITDPHGADQRRGELPARVVSLDENFIVVRRSANLALSRDLSGLHLFGIDLCVIADILGWNAYVVDFHLHHLSGGGRVNRSSRVDYAKLVPQRKQMIERYRRKLSDRLIKSPSTIVYLTRSATRSSVMNLRLVTRVLERLGRYWNYSG
jgi:hypothetical protein